MPSSLPPLPTDCEADRVAARIGVARQLVLIGRAGPARRLCGGLFVEHLPPIARDPALLRPFVECLLLLEMTVLLARLVRAVFGVDLRVTEVGMADSRRWMLSFSHGITLLMPRAEAGSEVEQETRAVFWARRICATATATGNGDSVAAGAGAGGGFRVDAENADFTRKEGKLLERSP